MRRRQAVAGWVHEEEGTTVEVEDCHIAFHFRHEAFVVLLFREIGTRTIAVHIRAIARPFCFYRRNSWHCICFPSGFHLLHRSNQDIPHVLLRRRKRDFANPHLPFYPWIFYRIPLLFRNGRWSWTVEQSS